MPIFSSSIYRPVSIWQLCCWKTTKSLWKIVLIKTIIISVIRAVRFVPLCGRRTTMRTDRRNKLWNRLRQQSSKIAMMGMKKAQSPSQPSVWIRLRTKLSQLSKRCRPIYTKSSMWWRNLQKSRLVSLARKSKRSVDTLQVWQKRSKTLISNDSVRSSRARYRSLSKQRPLKPIYFSQSTSSRKLCRSKQTKDVRNLLCCKIRSADSRNSRK